MMLRNSGRTGTAEIVTSNTKGDSTHPQAPLEPFDYERPLSLAAALALLAQGRPGTRLLAGGTDVMVEFARGPRAARTIDLGALTDELGAIVEDDDHLYVGALTTLNDVLAAANVRRGARPLYQACAEAGTPLLRTRMTVVGNCVTAWAEKDALVALVALGAVADLSSTAGTRSVLLESLFGEHRTAALRADELVRRIAIRKLGPGRRGIFLKFGLRPGHAHALVNVAVALEFAGATVRSARIVLGGVASAVTRATGAEAALAGETLDEAVRTRAAALAVSDLAPPDDVRASAGYRRSIARTLLARALARLADDTQDDAASESARLETPAPAPERLPFDGTLRTTINGVAYSVPAAAGRTLLDVVRDDAGLTGAKEGCAEGECGSCSVWLDGRAVTSCIVPAPHAHGGRVTTIEGLATNDELHPLQRAFIAHAAVQCGFCIPGMLMAGAKLIDAHPGASADDARRAIAGNICRCTGYRKIVAAIEDAAARARVTAP